jgi:hypothetical protein
VKKILARTTGKDKDVFANALHRNPYGIVAYSKGFSSKSYQVARIFLCRLKKRILPSLGSIVRYDIWYGIVGYLTITTV